MVSIRWTRSVYSAGFVRPHKIGLVILACMSLSLSASDEGRAADGNHGQRAEPQQQRSGKTSNDVIPGVVVIKFRHSISISGNAAARRSDPTLDAIRTLGVSSVTRAFPDAVPLNDDAVAAGKVDLSRIHLATIPTSLDPVDVAARLARLPEVEYAEPKYMYHLAVAPNDSDYTTLQEVYFDRMQVAAGWAIQKGNPNVVIATVDGGTNWQHPDLAANIWVNPKEDINHDGIFTPLPWPQGDLNGVDDDGDGKVDDVIGWNFGNNTNNPRGFLPGNAQHGTETASVFGAVTNNGIGMAGTSWNCKILPVCVSDATHDLDVPWGFEGIQYASHVGARVINCSWYRAGGPGNYSQYEQDVITAATQAGALIVAAAGNNYLQNLDDVPYYPASYDHVLSVGATKNSSDEIAYFTDIGLSVSVFAPGMGIHAARDDSGYGSDQGTSLAAPLVSGLAGLLFSAHPDWTPDQVAEQIRMTSDPIDAVNSDHAGSLGHGRVNFYRALSERHSGVVMETNTFRSPSGRRLFLEGDTVILGIRMKNVLTVGAENLSFSMTADPALIPLSPISAPRRLDAGAEDSLMLSFRVAHLEQKRTGKIRLNWEANSNEQDGHMFETTLYAGEGYWEPQQNPSGIPLWMVRAVSDRVAWATGTTGSASIVLRTVDGGEKWISATGNFPSDMAAVVFALDSLHAWVGDGRGSIFATSDGGVSWRIQLYPAPQSAFIDGIYFSDAMHGCAVGDPGSVPGRFVVLQTSDGGTTWTHILDEPVGAADEFSWLTAICWSDPEHIWFASWFSGQTLSRVWSSNDGGNTWSSLGERNGSVNSLAMRDDSVGIMCSGNVKTSDPAFFGLTTNGGTAWLPMSNVLTEKGTMTAYPAGSTKAWTAGQHTVAYSSNNGATWVEQPINQVSGVLNAISFSDPAHGWIVTQGGEILHYRARGEAVVSVVQPAVEQSSRAMLEQNYPNPFNPRTVIRSSVPPQAGRDGQTPEFSNVRIVIYDLLGREVKVLVNERRAAGYYEDSFDASGLASGVYIYRLTAGSFMQTRKMVLIK